MLQSFCSSIKLDKILKKGQIGGGYPGVPLQWGFLADDLKEDWFRNSRR